jgi:Zn-finger nucleic acid-binding protein
MKCPACDHALSTVEVGPIKVDACSGGCGGLWFDRLELRRVDESVEGAGAALLDIPRTRERVHPKLVCPRCDRQKMIQHLFHPTIRITVDECPRCAGMWLDAGELAEIRANAGTEAERHARAEATFEKTFGSRLAARREEHEAARARREAQAKTLSLLRWLR